MYNFCIIKCSNKVHLSEFVFLSTFLSTFGAFVGERADKVERRSAELGGAGQI